MTTVQCANFIGGEWTGSRSERTYRRENPAVIEAYLGKGAAHA